jgi:hypothetical protein
VATKVGYKADVYITSAPSVGLTNEATTADAGWLNYTITNAAKRYLDDTVTPLVQTSPDGTTWSTAVGYTLNYVGAIVTFGTARAVGTQIRFSTGSYFPYAQLGQSKEWSLEVDSTLLDVTPFSPAGAWKVYLDSINGATAKVGRYWLDGTFLATLVTGAKVVLVLYVDATSTTRYEAYAFLKSDSIKAAVTATVDEELSFVINGQLNFVA